MLIIYKSEEDIIIEPKDAGLLPKGKSKENPVPSIPGGGIAYTNNGNHVCLFFGQTPAYPVEHIGQMTGSQWENLLENPSVDAVTIRLKNG